MSYEKKYQHLNQKLVPFIEEELQKLENWAKFENEMDEDVQKETKRVREWFEKCKKTMKEYEERRIQGKYRVCIN